MNKYHGTVKEFLEAGHRFVEGDLCSDGAQFRQITDPSRWNTEGSTDDYWFVVYAACLNKEPEPEYKFKKCEFDYQWEALKEFEEGAEFYWHYHDEGRFVKCLIGKDVLISDSDDNLFRRTPLRTKTATYPMPETKAPENGTVYFIVTHNGSVISCIWGNYPIDLSRLKAGNVFLKREHAQAKADAQAVEIEG